MAFRKVESIRVSERVFDLVIDELEFMIENEEKINGWLQTFNNCREQGYYLTIEKNYKVVIYIWVFQSRYSDDIVVIHSKDYPMNGMFSDSDRQERNKHFNFNEEHKAKDYIIGLI